MSELSLIIEFLSWSKRARMILRSFMQSLHCIFLDVFIHWMGSPFQRILVFTFSLINLRTSLLFFASLQRCAKCLANASAPAQPPLPRQFLPALLFCPDSITDHTSSACSCVRFLRCRWVLPMYDLPVFLHINSQTMQNFLHSPLKMHFCYHLHQQWPI